jgi:hypothetical protein
MKQDYSYYAAIFQGFQRPFAFVDLDLLEENLNALMKRAGKKKVRLATKSIRSKEILRLLLNSTDQCQGLMCYSVNELCQLAEDGFDDLLMGYPSMDAEVVKQSCKYIKQGKKICFMVDLPEHIMMLQYIAAKEQVRIAVCLDIDMSVDFPGLHFGVYRSSITHESILQDRIELLKTCESLQVKGLMGYEAQIAGLGDRVKGNPLKNTVVRQLKKYSVKKIAARRAAAYHTLKAAFPEIDLVNAGGTGSLESSILEDVVTEVTIGSGFYQSHLFDHYSNFHHLPAAAFALEITRKPSASIITCAGGGYIASGSTSAEKAPLPYLPEGLTLLKNEGAGEVQTPLQTNATHDLKPGDSVYFRHAKAGELCEHFHSLYLVSKGKITGTAKTYRGDGHCFL